MLIPVHPPLILNSKNVSQVSFEKHLGVILDEILIHEEHFKMILSKMNFIGLLRKLQNLLPPNTLITIYKSFIRSHLDYGEIIYDETCNYSFHQRLQSVEHNACLAITEDIRVNSRDKLYQELGIESIRYVR